MISAILRVSGIMTVTFQRKRISLWMLPETGVIISVAPGAEPAEMDCGTLTQDADAADIYYAESTMYDGVSHQSLQGTEMFFFGMKKEITI